MGYRRRCRHPGGCSFGLDAIRPRPDVTLARDLAALTVGLKSAREESNLRIQALHTRVSEILQESNRKLNTKGKINRALWLVVAALGGMLIAALVGIKINIVGLLKNLGL
jgi:hypothetical protein